MATVNKGSIIYLGDYGVPEANKTKSVFRDVTDDAALSTLATALVAYSDAVIAGRSFSAQTDSGASPPAAGVCMDVKAQITLRDSDDGRVIRFLIPAPLDSIFSAEGQGDRVDAVTLAAIATAESTATGKSYVGLYGKKIQKS